MSKSVLAAAALLALAAAFLDGCRAPENPPPAPPKPAESGQDTFAAGANRQPTAKTLYAMAQCYSAQGRDDECAAVLNRSIKKYPSFLPAYTDLAELHMRHGRTDEAMRLLLAAVKIAPKDARLYNNLGMCFILRKDPQMALPRFSRAVALEPKEPRYRANMAMTLGLVGRYDESLALYSQVVKESDAHYNLGVVCRYRGDSERAGQEFAQAAKLAAASDVPASSPAQTFSPRPVLPTTAPQAPQSQPSSADKSSVSSTRLNCSTPTGRSILTSAAAGWTPNQSVNLPDELSTASR